MDVQLRGFSAADDAALQRLIDDPDVAQWNQMKGATAEAWRALRAQDEDTAHTWGVDDGGRLVGTVSLFAVDRAQGLCQIGYRVLPEDRGRGVASAALRLATAHVFAELGLRRVELYHALANPASCRVAERNGFRLEGTLRQSYVYGDGAAYDEHLHARLRDAPASTRFPDGARTGPAGV